MVRRAERFRLRVSDDQALTIESGGGVVHVGAKEGNTLRIDNPTVSRYHFEIEPTPLGFLLRDLGSTDGTCVDGYRVLAAYLPSRASLRAGEVTLAFELLDESVLIELSREERFGDALGRSPQMRELFSVLQKVAPKDL